MLMEAWLCPASHSSSPPHYDSDPGSIQVYTGHLAPLINLCSFGMAHRWQKLLRTALQFLFTMFLIATIMKMGNTLFGITPHHLYCGRPKNTLFFPMVPFSGADITTSIFWRFAIRHDVRVLLPKPDREKTYAAIDPEIHEVASPPYGVVASKLLYNPLNLVRYLPKNHTNIVQMRHPLKHLWSVLQDTNQKDLIGFPEEVRMINYVKNPVSYESWGAFSPTNNPFAVHLGLKKWLGRKPESAKLLTDRVDAEFPVVLIVERYDESLVMLRRIMCWSLQDILYKQDAVGFVESHLTSRDDLAFQHAKWAVADYSLYNHFAQKLENYVQSGGQGFKLELLEFRYVLTSVNKFCDNFHLTEGSVLSLPGGAYYDSFVYTLRNCTLLAASGRQLRNIIRKRQGSVPE